MLIPDGLERVGKRISAIQNNVFVNGIRGILWQKGIMSATTVRSESNIWLIRLTVCKLMKASDPNNSWVKFVAGPQLSEEAAIATDFCEVTGNLSKNASEVRLRSMHDTKLFIAMMQESTRGSR